MCDLDANDCNAPSLLGRFRFRNDRKLSLIITKRSVADSLMVAICSSLTIQPLSRSIFLLTLSILYKSRKNGLEKPILSNFARKGAHRTLDARDLM